MTGKSISLRIDPDTHDRITRLVERRKDTPQGVMREALTQYLDREEKREAYRQNALRAWDEHQQTGLHVDAAEVMAWLETWGEADELPPPKCHK